MITRFDPLAFLDVADRLAASSSDEAVLRTAIGRAYYALFILARDKLGITATRRVHTTVLARLKKRNVGLGDQLDSLKRLREVADYEPVPKKSNHRNWPHNWKRARELASWMLPKLKALP